MKIVVLDGHALNPGDLSWKGFEEIGEVSVYDNTNADQVVDRVRNAEVVLTNKVILDAAKIQRLSNLKYIGVLATGFNIVDVQATQKTKICVTNVPGYGIDSVAQHTFALILELTNSVGDNNRSTHAGEWSDSPDWCYWKRPMIELAGKTLGIIGLGTIGKRVAEIALAFGMEVIYHNRRAKEVTAERVDLPTLLHRSDIVTLHAALVEENVELMNADAFKEMKKEAFLINTSRGGLVNETDLANALNNKGIAGAAMDVLSSEPPSPDNPLLQAANCIITPHNAWATKESRARLMDIAVNNLRAYLEGKPQNVVN